MSLGVFGWSSISFFTSVAKGPQAGVSHSAESGWQLEVEGFEPCALELGPGCSEPEVVTAPLSLELRWVARGQERRAALAPDEIPASSDVGLLLLANGELRQVDQEVPTRVSEWTGEVVPGEQIRLLVYENESRTLPFVAAELLVNGQPLAAAKRRFSREGTGWILIEVLPDHVYGVTVQGPDSTPVCEHAVKGLNRGEQLSPAGSTSFGGRAAVAAVTSAY